MPTFEHISVYGNSFAGHTYGCSCCSDTVALYDIEEVKAAIKQVIADAQAKASRYEMLLAIAEKYGVKRMKLALHRRSAYISATYAIRAAQKAERGENAGTYGLEMLALGSTELSRRLQCIEAHIYPEDREIIAALDYRWE
jgi:hypothetical protein